jgi:hypothetical protein
MAVLGGAGGRSPIWMSTPKDIVRGAVVGGAQ